MTVNKKDFDALHEKVDQVREDVSEIKGLLKGRHNQNKETSTFIGIVVAIAIGILNWFK